MLPRHAKLVFVLRLVKDCAQCTKVKVIWAWCHANDEVWQAGTSAFLAPRHARTVNRHACVPLPRYLISPHPTPF